MGGVDPTITIPSLMISFAHGNVIKGELAVRNTVNVTLKQNPPAGSEDSLRWLMGEDSTAFGGAIRDMWTPTCMNDPGKVTDAQYHCATTDGGGVHSNSGVPNHGYALLVDGGTYNGQTIIAAWPCQGRAHLLAGAERLPDADDEFADHADALEASCTDLIGDPLEGLSTTSTPAGPSGQSISAADCTEVTDMIAAVEFRTEPTQCNFQPVLEPEHAGPLREPEESSGSLPGGLRGRAGRVDAHQPGVFAGWPGTNWAQDTSLPGGHAGSAAFGENLLQGNCDGGAGDVSGVMRLESPAIKLPGAANLSPRLTFEHYFATEAGWDGGNLKISINGGAFAVVPATAFSFNPYNGILNTAAAGNTNPLAGQPGFTGTDGGEVHGSWGASQIDLTRILASRRATRSSSGSTSAWTAAPAIDGWYVDNIKVQSCNVKKKP